MTCIPSAWVVPKPALGCFLPGRHLHGNHHRKGSLSRQNRNKTPQLFHRSSPSRQLGIRNANSPHQNGFFGWVAHQFLRTSAAFLDFEEMTTNAPDPTPDAPDALLSGLSLAEPIDEMNDIALRSASLASMYLLHGPPGQPARPAAPTCHLAPFIEPHTAPFPIRISTRDLSDFFVRYEPSSTACPWQDVRERGADEGSGDVPENKWVVYAAEEDGNIKLRMHRSWTGIKLIELTVDIFALRTSPEDTPFGDNGAPGTDTEAGRMMMNGGPEITHITFETHGDYKLKGADEGVYKDIAREVCWWVLGVFLGPETGA